MKKIPIWPKNTTARTQYWEMADEDRAWLLELFTRFMAHMQEAMTMDQDHLQALFRRRPESYPKGKNGPNSHMSMLGGIVTTLLDGRDITTPQLDAIESLTDLVAALEETEPARFSRRIWSHDAG